MNELALLSQSLIYQNMPFYIFWKDKTSTYLGANEYFAHSVGLKSIQEIIGKKDIDLPWAEDAEAFRESDRFVLQGNSIINAKEPRWHPEGQCLLIINKVPLKDKKNRIIGVLGMLQKLSAEGKHILPQKNDPIVIPLACKEILLNLRKISEIPLTHREVECLSLFLSGYSIKESSYCLGISHKSIEAYRKSVKDKMGVRHKFQLIELIQAKGAFNLCLTLAKLIQEQSKVSRTTYKSA